MRCQIMEAFEGIIRLLFAIYCFVMIGSVTRTRRKASRRGRRGGTTKYGRDMNGKAMRKPYERKGNRLGMTFRNY